MTKIEKILKELKELLSKKKKKKHGAAFFRGSRKELKW